MGLAFAAHFKLDFSIKCSLFDTPSMDIVSMSYLFFLPKIFKQNVLFSSYLDN